MNYRKIGALFLTLASLSAQAEERWFEVELLLFKRNVDIKDISEHLSAQAADVDTSNSMNLIKTNSNRECIAIGGCPATQNPTLLPSSLFQQQGNNVKRIADSALQLTAQRQQLARHARFTPLLHMGWQMPMQSNRVAKPIHLFAGKNFGSVNPNQVPSNEHTNVLLSNTGISETAVVNSHDVINRWEVDGNFKIYLDHYLFIDSQLTIRQAVTDTVLKQKNSGSVIDDVNGIQPLQPAVNEVIEVQQTTVKEILFDQNRRLRSGEIHYLDHPLMGIIVQIRKIAP